MHTAFEGVVGIGYSTGGEEGYKLIETSGKGKLKEKYQGIYISQNKVIQDWLIGDHGEK